MPGGKSSDNGFMKGFLVLDGPTGTELIARGFRSDPVLWTSRASLDAPELLRQVHLDYLAAGANIVTANTFRASAYAAEKAGLSRAEARRLAHTSVALATEAIEEAGGDVPRFLAGSIGPLEDCYKPWLVPSLGVLEKAHFETAGWLVESGCDLILVETMNTAREAVVAVRAARKAGAGAVAVGFISDATGQKLLGGDRLADAALLCVDSGAETVLVNCVHSDVIDQALPPLQELVVNGIVIGAAANASRMTIELNGDVTWEADPRPLEEQAREYGERARTWALSHHARIVGGCCGMTPIHIREVAKVLAQVGKPLVRK